MAEKATNKNSKGTEIERVPPPSDVDLELAAKAAKEAKAAKIQQAELEALNRFADIATKGMELLDAAKEAKPDEFQEQQTDFWKPEKVGEHLQGLYMGFIPDRYITHLIGTLDKKGEPLMMRVKGTKQLTSKLGRVKQGTAVRIVFEGTEKVDNGMLRKFSVSLLDVSHKTA